MVARRALGRGPAPGEGSGRLIAHGPSLDVGIRAHLPAAASNGARLEFHGSGLDRLLTKPFRPGHRLSLRRSVLATNASPTSTLSPPTPHELPLRASPLWHEHCMTVSGMDENRLRSAQPGSDACAGAAHVEGVLENSRIGGNADKAEDRYPGEADATRSIHRCFPPLPCRFVPAGLGIVSMQQQVDVGDYHRSSRRTTSLASISSTS